MCAIGEPAFRYVNYRYTVSEDEQFALSSAYGVAADAWLGFLLDLSQRTLLSKFKLVIGPPDKFWPGDFRIVSSEENVHLIYDNLLVHRYGFDGRFLDDDRLEADRMYLAYQSRFGYDLMEIATERLNEVEGSTLEDYSGIISLFEESITKGASLHTRARIYRSIGETYYSCGEYSKALQNLQRALECNPGVGVKRLVWRLQDLTRPSRAVCASPSGI